MTIRHLLPLFLPLFLPLAAAGSPVLAAQPAQEVAEAGPVAIGTRYTLRSGHLDSERTVNVRLPAGYAEEPERRYPVMYLLDGGAEQDFPHIAGLAQHAEISGTFERFIVVGIESVRRPWEFAFPSQDERLDDFLKPNGGSASMRAFIRDELRPFVESRFRTSGEDLLIGESLAGLFVVETLLRAPDLFDTYIAVSPSLWWNREALPAEAPQLLAAHDEAPRRLYLSVANEGGTLRRGVDAFVTALQSHAPATLEWRFLDRQNSETHASIYHEAALDALRSLYALPYREGSPARYPWVFTSAPPDYSADAQASLAGECTRATARRTTLARINADPNYWRGMCVLIDYGPPLPERGPVRTAQ